jgi:hypothetical protein
MIVLPHRRKAFRSGGGAFDPSDITGLEVDLRFNDSATLFDATSGGSLPADGGNTKRAEDRTANSRDALQSSSTTCPRRETAFMNGLDVLDFDGTDDYLLWEHTGFALQTFFVIFRLDVATFPAFDGVFVGQTFNPTLTSAPDRSFGVSGISGSAKIWTSDTSADAVWVNGVSANVTDFKSFSAGIDITAQTPVLVSYTSTATGTGTKNACIGADPYQGGGSRYFNGQIGAIIAYSGALGTTDRQAVENFLMAEWGI